MRTRRVQFHCPFPFIFHYDEQLNVSISVTINAALSAPHGVALSCFRSRKLPSQIIALHFVLGEIDSEER